MVSSCTFQDAFLCVIMSIDLWDNIVQFTGRYIIRLLELGKKVVGVKRQQGGKNNFKKAEYINSNSFVVLFDIYFLALFNVYYSKYFH